VILAHGREKEVVRRIIAGEPIGTIFIAGETVKRLGAEWGPLAHQEFVHILLPKPCYLNRVYFNAGMHTLERVS
jgi:hypothetical protein